MIDIFEKIRESEEAGNLAAFFPGLTNDAPTWHDFLQHLDAVSKREVEKVRAEGLNPKLEYTTGGIVRKGEYYSMSMIMPSDKHNYFSTLLPIEKQMEENLEDSKRIAREIGESHYMSDAFISFITDDEYATPHQDVYTDNFFVGCEGIVRWNIYKSAEDTEPTEVYDLKRGDAIFVRGTTFHEVQILAPRASVVFRMDVDDREAAN